LEEKKAIALVKIYISRNLAPKITLKYFSCFTLVICAFLFASCSDLEPQKDHRPIVFNDSATIVTETDSQYLKDSVMDMEAKALPLETSKETPEPIKAQVPVPENKVVTAEKQENGFVIDFGNFKAVITNLETREFKKQNPVNDLGVSYKVTSGDLTKSNLIISGVKNITVRQRYQSNLGLNANNQQLNLNNLGTYTSDWVNLNASHKNNQFIFDLKSLVSLTFKQISNATLKNAVQKELRNKRSNNKIVQEWLNSINKVKSANDKPCEIILNNVQWQLNGTDNNGKSFTKLIRIDA